MTDPIFVSSPVNVLHGDAARVALASTNDAAYYADGRGVLQVPLERWQQAQQYERETWLTYGLNLTEDRNAEHAAMFGDYAALPANLGYVIELGCGAFTNLRRILPGRTAKKVILLDPLAGAYMAAHPHCTYKDGKLCGYDTDVISHPIEYPQTWFKKLDTVVMVNVLPHCMDVQLVFKRIHAMLKKGGYLVFGEQARDIDPAQVYDVGHPLSYTQGVIDDFLQDFTPVYQHDGYFIGVKR
jgi:SAM-dependent methyltransferase